MIGDRFKPLGSLEDEAACMRLCVDFANDLDARRYDAVLDLFAEDGSLDRMGTMFAGRPAIAAFLAARPADMTTRHLCTNIRVSIESDSQASGSCYVLFFQGAGEQEAPVMTSAPSVVEYHDRFTRTAAGWRIHERRIRMALRAPD